MTITCMIRWLQNGKQEEVTWEWLECIRESKVSAADFGALYARKPAQEPLGFTSSSLKLVAAVTKT